MVQSLRRLYQNETDERRDIATSHAYFWALGDTAEEALAVIKASDAFKDNFKLLDPLSEPVPALSQERQADPKLVSDQLFNELQSSVYEGSALVFFVEAI
jgi:hypothetical protein